MSWNPQTWAARTVPLLVRVMLGAEPGDGYLLTDAALPETMRILWLEGFLTFSGRYVLPFQDASASKGRDANCAVRDLHSSIASWTSETSCF